MTFLEKDQLNRALRNYILKIAACHRLEIKDLGSLVPRFLVIIVTNN